jgi:hypothetical protein
MRLLDIRKEFVKKSGRYDLVVDVTAWADNGANFYINAAQKALDRMTELRRNLMRISVALDPDEYLVDMVKIARVISNVYAVNASKEVVKLGYKPRDWILYEMGMDVPDMDSGAPYYWTYTTSDSVVEARTIQVAPPVSEAYTIVVEGHFHEQTLVDMIGEPGEGETRTDESLWTVAYPEILIKAALWQLEIFYRNSEGAKDWLTAIQQELMLIEYDDCGDVYSQITQMEG